MIHMHNLYRREICTLPLWKLAIGKMYVVSCVAHALCVLACGLVCFAVALCVHHRCTARRHSSSRCFSFLCHAMHCLLNFSRPSSCLPCCRIQRLISAGT